MSRDIRCVYRILKMSDLASFRSLDSLSESIDGLDQIMCPLRRFLDKVNCECATNRGVHVGSRVGSFFTGVSRCFGSCEVSETFSTGDGGRCEDRTGKSIIEDL